MLITVTNVSDELLILKVPFSMGDFTVSVWSRTALQPGESATADLDLIAPYDGGSFSFDHNLDPREFLISISFDASDLLRVKDASDTITIPSGDNTPSLADGTDFGDTNVNATVSKTYIIENIGILPTAVSISVPSGYALTSSPSGVILPGEQSSFTVRFDASASGDISGNIAISTGSPNNYTFAITGHGNFYFEKVRSGLILYYLQNELAGTIANDDSPENNDGTYSNVTLNAIDSPVPGDRAPRYSNGFLTAFTPGFLADFNGQEGSIFLWIKMFDSSVWTDGLARRFLTLTVDGNNFIIMRKSSVNNRLEWFYISGGVSRIHTVSSLTTTDWFSMGMTFSLSGNLVEFIHHGIVINSNTIGTWAGTLSHECGFGARNLTPNEPHNGYESHGRIYNRKINAGEKTELQTIP